MLNESKKKEIAKTLLERIGKQYECPICHNNHFTIVDGYLVQGLQDNMNSIVLGNGPMIPSIAIVCIKCGFMSQHNLGVLGLMKKNDSTKEAL